MITPRCRWNWKCSCLIRWYLRIYFFTAGKKTINIWISGTWLMANYTILLFNQNVLLSVSRTAPRSLINKPLSLLRDKEGQTGRTPGAERYSNQLYLPSWHHGCPPPTHAKDSRLHADRGAQVRQLLLRKHLTETRQDSSPDGLPSRKQPTDSEN